MNKAEYNRQWMAGYRKRPVVRKRMKSYLENYVRKNPEKSHQYNETRRQKTLNNYHYAAEWKRVRGCVCGENDPDALDLHHIDPKTKTLPVSRMYHYTRKRIEEELAKCFVMCANCNRKKHAADRRGDKELRG